MKFEKNRMTFLEIKTNKVDDKDYHTLIFKDGEANKESLNFTGNISDFENLKENDFSVDDRLGSLLVDNLLLKLGRLTICSGYTDQDYEQFLSTTNRDSRIKIHPVQKLTFVQDDYIRNRYDSFKQLESAKAKEYMDRDEANSVIEN